MMGGSAQTTGICETPYSCRICTASAIVSLGWVCTSAGMSPFLACSTSPMVSPLAGLGEEAEAGQPLVVEHLGQVAAAAVGQQHHDHGVRVVELLGQLDRGERRHPGRAADQQPLLAGQPSRHRERVGVGDLDDPVGDGAVVGLGPEVLAHALDEVGAAAAARVHRAGGVGADHLTTSGFCSLR